MSEVTNPPEGKVTAENNASVKAILEEVSPNMRANVLRWIHEYAAIQSADLTRQLESATEETTIYRETAERVKEQNKALGSELEKMKIAVMSRGQTIRELDIEVERLKSSSQLIHEFEDAERGIIKLREALDKLESQNKALVGALEDAIERMNRARNILHKDEHSNWGMLDSSKQVAALRKSQNP